MNGIIIAAVLMIMSGGYSMATEEAKYDVVKRDGTFEVREYAPHVLAEVVVQGNLKDAGNKAFRILFRYISGGNRSGDKIAMTAPVGQVQAEEGWAVTFMMPAIYTRETLPDPDDPNVTLRQNPARRMAAVRYSGNWGETSYRRHLAELEAWIREQGLITAGPPVWARYNSPFTLWFLRRNEILIPIKAAGESAETLPSRPEVEDTDSVSRP